MSFGADGELEWRETYYILFQVGKRPTLSQVEAALTDASKRIHVDRLEGDEDGLFASVLVQAPEDHAALEITFEAGDAVVEQSAELAKQLKNEVESDQLKKLLAADARLDVMHFERVESRSYDDEEETLDMFDPSCLLLVVDVLAQLTDGLTIDPASGDILV